MKPEIEIIGVYPIQTSQPCYLVEIVIKNLGGRFDWGAVTQEQPNVPRSNWQVAYDEQLLEQLESGQHFVFFFHYLDFSKPLMTPLGTVALPKPTEIPARLRDIKYEPPD